MKVKELLDYLLDLYPLDLSMPFDQENWDCRLGQSIIRFQSDFNP